MDVECYSDGIISYHIPIWSRRRLVVRGLWNVNNITFIGFLIYYADTNLVSASIIVFSVIASKVKENANGARTFLEIVRARFGTPAHVMFLVSTIWNVHVSYTQLMRITSFTLFSRL